MGRPYATVFHTKYVALNAITPNPVPHPLTHSAKMKAQASPF